MADADRKKALEEKKKRLELMREEKKKREEEQARKASEVPVPSAPVKVDLPIAEVSVDNLVNSLLATSMPISHNSSTLSVDSTRQDSITSNFIPESTASPTPAKSKQVILTTVKSVSSLYIPSSIPEKYDKYCQTDDIESDHSFPEEESQSDESHKVHRRPPAVKTGSIPSEESASPLVAYSSIDAVGTVSSPPFRGGPLSFDRPERLLGEEEIGKIVVSESFKNFLDYSTIVIERALNQASTCDILRDYRSDDAASKAQFEKSSMLLSLVFDDESVRGRPVMDIQFSPHFPELFLVAYGAKQISHATSTSSRAPTATAATAINKSSRSGGSAEEEAQGLVYVWSIGVPGAPEFKFIASSPVLTAMFHDDDKHLIVGGCYTGQILLWDMKAKRTLPVQRSSLAGRGHKHPVYSLSFSGSGASSAPNSPSSMELVSVSTDGTLCHWDTTRLTEPTTEISLQELISPTATGQGWGGMASGSRAGGDHGQGLSVNISSMAFSLADASRGRDLVLGSGLGHIFRSAVPLRAGERVQEVPGHRGLVTAMKLNPSTNKQYSSLLLTSSLDWTVKLWDLSTWGGAARVAPTAAGTSSSAAASGGSSGAGTAANITPIFEFFSETYDYICDVQWCPTHPALFCTVSSGGSLSLWDLSKPNNSEPVETVRSVFRDGVEETTGGPAVGALSKIAWSRDGHTLLVGDARGGVRIVTVKDSVTKFSPSDESRYQLVLHSSTSSATAGVKNEGTNSSSASAAGIGGEAGTIPVDDMLLSPVPARGVSALAGGSHRSGGAPSSEVEGGGVPSRIDISDKVSGRGLQGDFDDI